MNKGILKISFILLALLLQWGMAPRPANAEWQTLLNEHFNTDQRRPNVNNRWPWYTVAGQKRWHWNPWNPHNRWEPVVTDHCWGLQDYIFNSKMIQNEEAWEHMSIWCARTNHNDVDHPFYPDEDMYQHDQNAWVWWGSIDLRRAKSAAVSFWVYMDMARYAGDSLTVTVIPDSLLICDLVYDFDYFHANVPWGKIFKTTTDGWQYNEFYLDSLFLGDDTISYLGERELYVAFVWQSDGFDIAGRGAFIDDVVVSWDDGLFNISPVGAFFGYYINEDSTYWSNQEPGIEDSVRLRLDWKAVGSQGQVPAFNNNCLIDGNLFYTERCSVYVDPADTSTYTFSNITDQYWHVPPDNHVVRWVLDADSAVEESNEVDNWMEILVTNEYNPPPEMEIANPSQGTTEVRVDTTTYRVEYNITDSSETDERFSVFFYWARDTSGLAATSDFFFWTQDTTGKASGLLPINIYFDFSVTRGVNYFDWDLRRAYADGLIDIGQVGYIVGAVNDSKPANLTVVVSPGQLLFIPPLNVFEGKNGGTPLSYSLSPAYPNPFNRGVNLEFALPVAGRVKLAAYDLTGREMETLVNGNIAAGRHQLSWTPQGIPGGVYLMRMEAGGKVFLQKAVYMP